MSATIALIMEVETSSCVDAIDQHAMTSLLDLDRGVLLTAYPSKPVDLFKRVKISLKFPSGSKSKNQVVIHGGFRERWVTVSPKEERSLKI